MTNAARFAAAHAETRRIVAAHGVSYRIQFAICLKAAYAPAPATPYYIMDHISRSPRGEATYNSVEDALTALAAPRWAGDDVKTVTPVRQADTYKMQGLLYYIVKGENPRTAKRAEAATPQHDSTAATAKQLAYIASLARRCDCDAREYFIWRDGGALTKAQASRLIDDLKLEDY